MDWRERFLPAVATCPCGITITVLFLAVKPFFGWMRMNPFI
jgi:hypothetical protein